MIWVHMGKINRCWDRSCQCWDGAGTGLGLGGDFRMWYARMILGRPRVDRLLRYYLWMSFPDVWNFVEAFVVFVTTSCSGAWFECGSLRVMVNNTDGHVRGGPSNLHVEIKIGCGLVPILYLIPMEKSGENFEIVREIWKKLFTHFCDTPKFVICFWNRRERVVILTYLVSGKTTTTLL